MEYKELPALVEYVIGSCEEQSRIETIHARVPFDDEVISFLNDLSQTIRKNPESREYSDVATFGFLIFFVYWNKMWDEYLPEDGRIKRGRGILFHIAPSNVPVNFAYSLVAGLLTGNANIVRIPGKHFPQIDILVEAIRETLIRHEEIRPYVFCVRYERNRELNDFFSGLSDVRIVWGGDHTIQELRKSPLPPRSKEITFADRYSFCVIDADTYLSMEDKDRVAQSFYNDTYLSDQNACTSPSLVVWLGRQRQQAKEIFWSQLHRIVRERYEFSAIQSVNKLMSLCRSAVALPGICAEETQDNRLTRMFIKEINDKVMDNRENSGFFFEYDCEDIRELQIICEDKRCQTIGYIGDKVMFEPLLEMGVRGVDRIVPVGATMDFDLVWDGYDLVSELTRVVGVR